MIYNDASIKSKDVKTDENGDYTTTDNIIILNVVSINKTDFLHWVEFVLFYAMHCSDNKTIISVYMPGAHVDHESLNKYLDNNRDENTSIRVIHDHMDPIDIRIYYINR